MAFQSFSGEGRAGSRYRPPFAYLAVVFSNFDPSVYAAKSAGNGR